MAGTHTVWENSYQIGRGPLGGYSTSRGTRRQVERFVIHPNQIKTLPTGEAIVITKTPAADVQVVRVSPPRNTTEMGAAASGEDRAGPTPGTPLPPAREPGARGSGPAPSTDLDRRPRGTDRRTGAVERGSGERRNGPPAPQGRGLDLG
jgi:hypothetical protein